jgi:hypothetical protein
VSSCTASDLTPASATFLAGKGGRGTCQRLVSKEVCMWTDDDRGRQRRTDLDTQTRAADQQHIRRTHLLHRVSAQHVPAEAAPRVTTQTGRDCLQRRGGEEIRTAGASTGSRQSCGRPWKADVRAPRRHSQQVNDWAGRGSGGATCKWC